MGLKHILIGLVAVLLMTSVCSASPLDKGSANPPHIQWGGAYTQFYYSGDGGLVGWETQLHVDNNGGPGLVRFQVTALSKYRAPLYPDVTNVISATFDMDTGANYILWFHAMADGIGAESNCKPLYNPSPPGWLPSVTVSSPQASNSKIETNVIGYNWPCLFVPLDFYRTDYDGQPMKLVSASGVTILPVVPRAYLPLLLRR
jgi:hypothetical protein